VRRVFGVGEGDEGLEFFAGGAGINGLGGEADAVNEIGGASGGDESGGSIGEDDVAMSAVFAIEERAAEDFVNDFSVVLGVAATNRFARRAAESEILGDDRVAANSAVAEFGDVGLAGDGNFVHAVRAVDDEGAADAEFAKRESERLGEFRGGDADELRGGPGGIRERTEEIENRADAEIAARVDGVFHGRVHGGSEKEADADFFDGAADAFGGLMERDAEGFEDIGGAAAGTDGAIAVLGDADSRAGNDERRGGGNVERAGDIAARAAGVHQRFIGVSAAAGENRSGVAAHGRGEADEFVHRLAFDAQSDEQAGDLRVGGAAGKDLFHHGFGFDAREVFAGDDFFNGVENHGSTCIRNAVHAAPSNVYVFTRHEEFFIFPNVLRR
jgi:hypothetical protein